MIEEECQSDGVSEDQSIGVLEWSARVLQKRSAAVAEWRGLHVRRE